jgi:hypothetical protein
MRTPTIGDYVEVLHSNADTDQYFGTIEKNDGKTHFLIRTDEARNTTGWATVCHWRKDICYLAVRPEEREAADQSDYYQAITGE